MDDGLLHAHVHVHAYVIVNMCMYMYVCTVHVRMYMHVHVMYLCRMLVRGLTQGLLNEHEIITLAREYGEKSWPPLSSLVWIIHADLKQQNYMAFRSGNGTIKVANR